MGEEFKTLGAMEDIKTLGGYPKPPEDREDLGALPQTLPRGSPPWNPDVQGHYMLPRGRMRGMVGYFEDCKSLRL